MIMNARYEGNCRKRRKRPKPILLSIIRSVILPLSIMTVLVLSSMILMIIASNNVSALSIDKNEYSLGEPVKIMLNNSELSYSLELNTPSGIFKYLGNLENELSFFPQETGSFSLQLYDGPELISEESFTVIEQTVNEELNNSYENIENDTNNSNNANTNPYTSITNTNNTNNTGNTDIINDANTNSNTNTTDDADSNNTNNTNYPVNNNENSIRETTTRTPSIQELEISTINTNWQLINITYDKNETLQEKGNRTESIKKIYDELSDKGVISLTPETEGSTIKISSDQLSRTSTSQLEQLLTEELPTIRAATIEDEIGNPIDANIIINKTTKDVSISWKRSVKPGVYRLIITKNDYSTEVVYFAAGLISINSDKPIYHPGEEAELTFVVLDDGGYPVSGAEINATIIAPDNTTIKLTTTDGTIWETEKRGVYQAIIRTKENLEGTYQMIAHSKVKELPVSINSYFLTKKKYEFNIIRTVPATINPWEGPYTNTFYIEPLINLTKIGINDDYYYEFTEVIPISFNITEAPRATIIKNPLEGVQYITWYLSGATIVSYSAQTPYKSPYLYELGKAKIRYRDDNAKIKTFEEARPWLFAIDPAALICEESPCDSGTLIDSRDSISGAAEPNQPNTIDSCSDGTSGSYHSDESIDKMVIKSLNHTYFVAGDTVEVNITVWCWGTSDNLNWVYTTDSNNPSWVVKNSTDCPGGGASYTFSSQFKLGTNPGNHTIRGVFQYNGANTDTCGTGNYDDNDDLTIVVLEPDDTPPKNKNLAVNDTSLAVNDSVLVIADVDDDVSGVDSVIATVDNPQGQKENLTLNYSVTEISESTTDLESGIRSYEATYFPAGRVNVQSGTVTFASGDTSKELTINPVNLSSTFVLISSTSARANANQFTFTASLTDSSTLKIERLGSGIEADVGYYVVDASNIEVYHGRTTFTTSDTTKDITISDQGSDYQTKTAVIVLSASDSASRSYVNERYVTGELTSSTNLRLQRDDSGNAGLTVDYYIVKFLDETTVQTGEVSVTTTGSATINSINTSNSWLYFTTRMSANGLAYTSIIGNITDSTTLSFSRISSSGTAYARYYVISFPNSGSKVQAGTLNSGTSVSQEDITINQVNLSRTFSFSTEDSTGTGTAYPRPWWVNTLTSSTNLRIYRSYTGQSSNHDWQVITWPKKESEPDIEEEKLLSTYQDVNDGNFTSINSITVKTHINNYDDSGSEERNNNNPDLKIELYNGSNWINIGALSVTNSGYYEITTTNNNLLTNWLNNPSYRDVRITAINMDYYDDNNKDQISYDEVRVIIKGNAPRYTAIYNKTENTGYYYITDLYATDNRGNLNHTTYPADSTTPDSVYFTVYNYGPPTITINDISGDATSPYATTDQTPDFNITVNTDANCYLSLYDESYAEMVANNRVNCGAYTMNTPKTCSYPTTLDVGSTNFYIACNNTLSGATNNQTNNKDITVDILCDDHADCQSNEFCDYTYHCHLDIVDGFDCKEVTYNSAPADEACGDGTTDLGTCINDSSYNFTGWYCAHDQDDCVYNDSGHTYDLNYALCDPTITGYRTCDVGQVWSALTTCGSQYDGYDPSGTTHPGANCSYIDNDPNCISGDLDLGSYGCNLSITTCGPHIYSGGGVCGSTLADCDLGCGAQCDSSNSTTPEIINNTCYYDKSCSDDCLFSQNSEEAPLFCINDNDGGPCAYDNRTNPGLTDTCYYNTTCENTAGASLTNSTALRTDYCDYCTATGAVTGDYSPAPNASCHYNCSNSGTIYYDPQLTPADRSDDCDGKGNTLLLTDTLSPGDIWNSTGPAYCDDQECDLDCGDYLVGTCDYSTTTDGTCVCTDYEPPIITLIQPQDNHWFNNRPLEFSFSVIDYGSGVENCSLLIDGDVVNTTYNPTENSTIILSYNPSSPGSLTWAIKCYDDSTNHNSNTSETRNSGYDNTIPSITSADINQTRFKINQYICINATVSDTYSGLKYVYAEIELPGGIGKVNVTMNDDPTTCDSATGNGVYSIEYKLVFSGEYNLTKIYAIDQATNTGSYAPTGKNWTVAAAGVLEATLTTPPPNSELLINESSSPSTNYDYYQNCSVLCSDKGIECEGVKLLVEYNNGSTVEQQASDLYYLPANTSNQNLIADINYYECGNLTPAPPAWWNSSWDYRREINITHRAESVTEYQMKIYLDTASLISAGKMRSDCGDARFITENGEEISYYMDTEPSITCNTNQTLFWVKIPNLEQNAYNRIFVYYGNPTATTTSNISTTFSYSSQKPLYYAVGDFATRGDMTAISYTDNNQVTLHSSASGDITTTLNKGESYTFSASDISAGDYWSATGPLSFASATADTEGPNPISFAGTNFFYFIDRGGSNKEWFVYAPFGNGEVHIYDANITDSDYTLLKSFSVAKGTRYYITDADGNDNFVFKVNSTTPILLAYEYSSADTMVMVPATTGDVWGIKETTTFGVPDSTVTICQNNVACTNYTKTGINWVNLGGSSDGLASAVHSYSQNIISFIATADSDGLESYTGLPKEELNPEYYIPVGFQYLAGSVSNGTSCYWYNKTNNQWITVSLSGSYDYPAPKKLYVGDGSSSPADDYGGNGDIIKCDYPFFLAMEPNNDDEMLMIGYKQARQIVDPEPTYRLLAETQETDLDYSNSICYYQFHITSGEEAGNNTWPVRCRADADNAATQFSQSFNLTINDHPTSELSSPLNNTWLSGTVLLNGTLSKDSDGTITNYWFYYSNDSFNTYTTVCNGPSPTCAFNTTAQTGCLNNSLSCTIRLRVTDDHGLTDDDEIIVGFDTKGPTAILDEPKSFENISAIYGNLIKINATITDYEVGTIDTATFQYRENNTATWKEACLDNSGSSPFECYWNISEVLDGNYYEVRVFANDTLGNTGLITTSAIHTNITIDREGPISTITAPANNSYNNGSVTLSYLAYDRLRTIDRCSLLIDGLSEQTNYTVVENTSTTGPLNYFSITNLTEGTHTLKIVCYDDLGNTKESEPITVITDLTGPSITINKPLSGSLITGDTYLINATVTDAGAGVDKVFFYYRPSPDANWTYLCNSTGTTATNDYTCLWNLTTLADRSTYQVLVWANDSLGNEGPETINYNIKLDNDPPIVTLISPADGYKDTDGNVTFYYSVNDVVSTVDNCSLYINGTLNQTTTNPAEETTLSFFIGGLNDTTLSWGITCYDSLGHRSSSENRTLIIKIEYVLNNSLTSPKSEYQYGDEAGETAEFTTNTTDAYGNSLQALMDSDIIRTTGDCQDGWWNSAWDYRKRFTIDEGAAIERVNQMVSFPITLDPNCEGLASKESLRLIQGYNRSLSFNIWNITTCSSGSIKSFWFSFKLNISSTTSQNFYIYFDPSTTMTQKAVEHRPMKLLFVTSGGSGNGPNTAAVESNLKNALTALGFDNATFYDVQTMDASSGSTDLSSSDLDGYSIVLFDAAAKYNDGITQSEANVLASFMQSSGAVFLTGQDIGYDANQDSWISTTDFTLLTHLSGWTDDTNANTVSVNTSYATTSFLASGSSSSVTGSYPDGYTTLLGSAINTLVWPGNANPLVGTAYNGLYDSGCSGTPCGKSAYYGGIFYDSSGAGIQNASFRTDLLKGFVDWAVFDNNLSISYGVLEEFVTDMSNASDTGTDGLYTDYFNVFGYSVGEYCAVSEAYKTKYNDAPAWFEFNISIDSQPPIVSLVSPHNGSEANSSVTFAYKVSDPLSSISNCTLYIDGNPTDTDDTIQEDISQFFYPRIPGVGPHNWSVGCYDAEGNFAMSEEWVIIIIPPDLTSSYGNISVTNGPYRENMNLSVNITVWNMGGSDTATNFTVLIYDGPYNSSDSQLLQNFSLNLTDQYGDHQNETLSFYYLVHRPGLSQLFVEIDAPIDNNGTILELNESNNLFIINISVPAYTKFIGNVSTDIVLATSENYSIINYTGVINNTGLLYFADSDSNVQFDTLRALGKRLDNTSAPDDFEEADALLNMSGFNDSVNILWTNGTGYPEETKNITVMGYLVYEVPVIPSDSHGNFVTGILWDYSDDVSNNQEYDSTDKEDLLFIANIDHAKQGDYGVYDFEAKVPAPLRNYAGSSGDKVALYYEIK